MELGRVVHDALYNIQGNRYRVTMRVAPAGGVDALIVADRDGRRFMTHGATIGDAEDRARRLIEKVTIHPDRADDIAGEFA